ncbi:YcgL domain-containing protein [Solidesulfovibrio alcoholivorans]|uniref:YcgL domain-containing protein n=1 Tax=Solidesulfovibrio alcoholivorans TaxID=81406 RepID=UPI0009FE3464|nr:YcgL domain-containing protein [Solidesulfovibrio alcoholivorans]
MPFAIHKSKSDAKLYIFTRGKEDFSYVPGGLLEEIGKIRFLRTSFPIESETKLISPRYKEIENFVAAKKYYILRLG